MKKRSNLKINSVLHDFGAGTQFEKTDSVRIKLTHKDLILIAGIVVAAIIALTTLIMDSSLPQGEVRPFPSLMKSTPSPQVLINKLGHSIFRR